MIQGFVVSAKAVTQEVPGKTTKRIMPLALRERACPGFDPGCAPFAPNERSAGEGLAALQR
jgi:hypothetical protein